MSTETNHHIHHRIYSHLTRTRFLHVEDALEIGKLRLFAGEYKRGEGASVTVAHYLDVADARVLFSDLAWGKPVEYVEFKGTAGGEGEPISRVFKAKSKGDRVWFRLENGPGQVFGEGAVKPAGKPDFVANVPFTISEVRKLAMAVLAHLQAWEVITFRQRTSEAALCQ